MLRWQGGLAGEGPKALVANAGVEGCNGGDSRHVLDYLRHLARSTTAGGPQDERVRVAWRMHAGLGSTDPSGLYQYTTWLSAELVPARCK